MLKFKVDDEVIIIGNTANHGFRDGEKVKLLQKTYDKWMAQDSTGELKYWVAEEDISYEVTFPELDETKDVKWEKPERVEKKKDIIADYFSGKVLFKCDGNVHGDISIKISDKELPVTIEVGGLKIKLI